MSVLCRTTQYTMPQQRQRIVFCDCLDCVQQPPMTDIVSSNSPANEAAARQEPPPKCVMFILSGVLLSSQHQSSQRQDGTMLDSCNLPHLNRATAQGNLCLLTLREGTAAGSFFTATCSPSASSSCTAVCTCHCK